MVQALGLCYAWAKDSEEVHNFFTRLRLQNAGPNPGRAIETQKQN